MKIQRCPKCGCIAYLGFARVECVGNGCENRSPAWAEEISALAEADKDFKQAVIEDNLARFRRVIDAAIPKKQKII